MRAWVTQLTIGGDSRKRELCLVLCHSFHHQRAGGPSCSHGSAVPESEPRKSPIRTERAAAMTWSRETRGELTSTAGTGENQAQRCH
jgi:hypothetical protein